MQNLISEAVYANEGFVTYRNITAAWSEGIEGEIDWNPRQWIMLSTHGTLQKSQDEVYHTSLDYIPGSTFGSSVNVSRIFNTVKIVGNIGFNYVGSRSFLDFPHANLLFLPNGQTKLQPPVIPLGSYNTMDLSCKISLRAYWLTLAAQNIYNTRYEESEGTVAPGRFATIKIGYNF
jgi:outer membrane receptor protein involved in Fe transport